MKEPNPDFPITEQFLDEVFDKEDRARFEYWLASQVQWAKREGATNEEIQSWLGDTLIKLFKFTTQQ